MSTLALTIFIASFFVVAALALLGISWIFTGKSTIKPGACGRDPHKLRSEKDCEGFSCDLCKKPEDVKKNESVR